MGSVFVEVDRDGRPRRYVTVRYHGSQRLCQVKVDDPPQLPRSVLHARPLLEHEESGTWSHLDVERSAAESALDVML